MQTTPGNGKGRRPGQTPTPMQTRSHSGASARHVGTDVQTFARLTPRNRRLLLALIDGPQTREAVDRITGASNGPDEVRQARRKFALVLPCVRKGAKDRDGRRVEFGTYSLAPTDRNKARALLKGAR